jgi:hypothetical protein
MANFDTAIGIPGNDAPAVIGQLNFILGEGLEKGAVGALSQHEHPQVGWGDSGHVIQSRQQEAREIMPGINVGMGINMETDGFHSGVAAAGG